MDIYLRHPTRVDPDWALVTPALEDRKKAYLYAANPTASSLHEEETTKTVRWSRDVVGLIPECLNVASFIAHLL